MRMFCQNRVKSGRRESALGEDGNEAFPNRHSDPSELHGHSKAQGLCLRPKRSFRPSSAPCGRASKAGSSQAVSGWRATGVLEAGVRKEGLCPHPLLLSGPLAHCASQHWGAGPGAGRSISAPTSSKAEPGLELRPGPQSHEPRHHGRTLAAAWCQRARQSSLVDAGCLCAAGQPQGGGACAARVPQGSSNAEQRSGWLLSANKLPPVQACAHLCFHNSGVPAV